MKLSITPTPAGTGYRCECLDLPGTPPVGEGSTEAEAVACLFLRMLSERGDWFKYVKTGTIIINGVPWRREGERGEKPLENEINMVSKALASNTSGSASQDLAVAASWQHIRAALKAAPPAPTPAVGVPVNKDTIKSAISELCAIICDDTSTDDEKKMALDTLHEAIEPSSPIDLEKGWPEQPIARQVYVDTWPSLGVPVDAEHDEGERK